MKLIASVRSWGSMTSVDAEMWNDAPGRTQAKVLALRRRY